MGDATVVFSVGYLFVGSVQKTGLKPGGGSGAGELPVLSLVTRLERAVGVVFDPIVSARAGLAKRAAPDCDDGVGQSVGMAGLAFAGMVSFAATDNHRSHRPAAPVYDLIPDRYANSFN